MCGNSINQIVFHFNLNLFRDNKNKPADFGFIAVMDHRIGPAFGIDKVVWLVPGFPKEIGDQVLIKRFPGLKYMRIP